MTKQWSVVVLHFGYVESSLVSPMIFVNRRGEWPDSKLDAVRDVATWFMKKWIVDHEWSENPELEECCRKARTKKKPPRFCPDCGEATAQAEFDVEDYREWLMSCQGLTAEGFGWDGIGEESWSCWGKFDQVMRTDRLVEIEENAQDVLTYALQPENLPDGIAKAIKAYREEVVQNHPQNCLSKAGLDADQLADFEAKARSRA